MRTSKLYILMATLLAMTSCVVHTDHGPYGADGRAYFGVDYHFSPPYSYWDNNSRIPDNPYFGDFFRTDEGIYDFEYFINPWDYWYGSYQIWIDRGTEGGPYGQAGYDGLDTYLMLYLDPEGWHEDRFDQKSNVTVLQRTENKIEIEVKEKGATYRLVMNKTNINERPTSKVPKYSREK